MSDEIKKICLNIGYAQALLIAEIGTFYINATDLIKISCAVQNNSAGFLYVIIFLAGFYQYFAFYLNHEYVMKLDSVNVGRIQYLRNKFWKIIFKVFFINYKK